MFFERERRRDLTRKRSNDGAANILTEGKDKSRIVHCDERGSIDTRKNRFII